MVVADPLWYFTPAQIATIVFAGANCGASSLQSPLTWPMLQYVDVPVQYVGRQTAHLLHGSEFIFPPLNAFCTLGNTILATIAYRQSDTNQVAAGKYPILALAAGIHVAITVYTLSVMAPYNRRLTRLSAEINRGVERGEEKTEGQSKKVDEFRQAQSSWKILNYGRGAIMLASVITSAIGVSIH